jgi:NIMA (never in mitosis gene a)-related kinase
MRKIEGLEKKLNQQFRILPKRRLDLERIEKLGQGAYGSVYLAIDQQTEEKVTLKKVKLRFLPKPDRAQALKEIELLSSLKHPNIVTYKDSF